MHIRHRLSIRTTSIAILVAVSGPLQAQNTRADSAAVLLETARRLQLEGQHSASSELLAHIAQHYQGTPAALEASTAYSENRDRLDSRSGRASLIAFHTLYGAWLGTAVPAALGADEPAPYGAGLLIGAPLGFVAARAFAGRFPMSSGQATLTSFGAVWGTWQGIGWQSALDLGKRTVTVCDHGPCFSYQTEAHEAPYRAAIVGGLTGLITCGILAQTFDPSHGAATMVEFGAFWGTWYGFAAAILADIEDENALLIWTLTGGNAGLATAALTSNIWEMSAGRAKIIGAAGLAGGVAGLGIDLLVEVRDEETAVLIPTLTSIAGLIAGTYMTKHYDSGSHASVGTGGGLGFVSVRSGNWSIDLPALQPSRMVRPDRNRGITSGFGVKVAAFSAEF